MPPSPQGKNRPQQFPFPLQTDGNAQKQTQIPRNAPGWALTVFALLALQRLQSCEKQTSIPSVSTTWDGGKQENASQPHFGEHTPVAPTNFHLKPTPSPEISLAAEPACQAGLLLQIEAMTTRIINLFNDTRAL